MNKLKYIVVGCLTLLLVVCYLNWKCEVIAFNPSWIDGQHELKAMTWNVHSSKGAGNERQKKMAELILREDADFVQLNEYHQDSCSIMDTMLRTKYDYTEESQSHQRCGDIFYSKYKMYNSGRVKIPGHRNVIRPIMATIFVSKDSVQIFGIHMASNLDDDKTSGKLFENDNTSSSRYYLAQEKRCYQAHWLMATVKESKHPVIVMGDMNDFNRSAPLETLTHSGLKDSWWEGGNGYGTTFHCGWLRLRIDHILHSDKLKLESIKVIDTELSDHNPVVAGFRLKNE